MSAVLKKKIGRTSQGLARVRKELPPPVKILRNRKKDNRKNWKEKLRQELQESLQDNVS